MDFISIPVTFGIVSFFMYKFFELLICRKERLSLIERMDGSSLLEYLKQVRMGINLGSMTSSESLRLNYPASWSLRIGSLIFGMGLGLIVGIVMNRFVNCDNGYAVREMLVGGSVLCLGGLGLLVAFCIEYGIYKNADGEKK